MAVHPFTPKDRPLWERMRSALCALRDLVCKVAKQKPEDGFDAKHPFVGRVSQALQKLGKVWVDAALYRSHWELWPRANKSWDQARSFLNLACFLEGDEWKAASISDCRIGGISVSVYVAAELNGEIGCLREELEDFAETLLATTEPPAKPRLAKVTMVRKRRRNPPRDAMPLTPGQLEALQLLGEHKGNQTAAAKAAGISRPALMKRYNKAMKKLPRSAAVIKKKPTAKPLPLDRRGQVNLSAEEE
jgi:predicted DNA-binding protein (UPF0251 family)